MNLFVLCMTCTFPLLLLRVVPTTSGKLICLVLCVSSVGLRLLLAHFGIIGMLRFVTSSPVLVPEFTPCTEVVCGLTKVTLVVL